MAEWGPCKKQEVTCVILTPDGQEVVGVNRCRTAGWANCPRVLSGCETGENYSLCGPPIHAEEAAIAKAKEQGIDIEGGVAFLTGHNYYCPDCQKALVDAGVRCFNLCED